MGELHLPRLRGTVGFIADSSWREYSIEVFHDFPGQLVGQNAFNIGCGKQFGGCALPCSDTIDVLYQRDSRLSGQFSQRISKRDG